MPVLQITASRYPRPRLANVRHGRRRRLEGNVLVRLFHHLVWHQPVRDAQHVRQLSPAPWRADVFERLARRAAHPLERKVERLFEVFGRDRVPGADDCRVQPRNAVRRPFGRDRAINKR
jgi:hypothetical protein